MPKGLRQFSTLPVQGVLKADVRSAGHFLPRRRSQGKNWVWEGKANSSPDSLKLFKTRNAGWRGVRGQNPTTFRYWYCNIRGRCQSLSARATTAPSAGRLMRCFGWGGDGERFLCKGNVEGDNNRTRRGKYWSFLEKIRYIFQMLRVSYVTIISSILWQPYVTRRVLWKGSSLIRTYFRYKRLKRSRVWKNCLMARDDQFQSV